MADKTSEILKRTIHSQANLAERLARFVDAGAERGILSVLLTCPDKFQE